MPRSTVCSAVMALAMTARLFSPETADPGGVSVCTMS